MMISKRTAIEALYWNDLSPEVIFDRLVSKYAGLTPEYVEEVCTMLEDDDFLNEGNVGG